MFGRGAAVRIHVSLDALQIRAKFRGGLITQIGIFFQRLGENIFQGRGKSGIQFRCGRCRGIQDAVEDQGYARAGKRKRTRRHLIQHDAERK
jgi:hypothetical protein